MSQKARKFAHRAMFDQWGRGRLRVICSCGKHSKVLKDNENQTAREQGDQWFLGHTGLKEIHPRGRKIKNDQDAES